MLMCEFLTAVHHKLPVKAVVYNNSSLGLIRLEAESMGLPAWKAMDFPNPDYVALARACGAVGFKAEKPDELAGAIDLALKAEGPAIVSCIDPADELPNFARRSGKGRKFRQGEDQGNDTRNHPRVTEARREWPTCGASVAVADLSPSLVRTGFWSLRVSPRRFCRIAKVEACKTTCKFDGSRNWESRWRSFRGCPLAATALVPPCPGGRVTGLSSPSTIRTAMRRSYRRSRRGGSAELDEALEALRA